MVNFIVHEENPELKTMYETVIFNFLGGREEKFKIFDYNKFKKNSSCIGNIYVIGKEKIECALEIAEEIRANDDWNSQIVIVSSLNNENEKMLNNQLLILDFIERSEIKSIAEKLKRDLFIAYNILSKDKTLNFLLNGEIHKISYNNILYIEKSNNKNYCIIYTKDNEYMIKDTINNLENILDSALFMKTHRSCIVNLQNIEYYNYSENIIYFKDKQTDLISRDKRQFLKAKLIEDKTLN